MGGPCSEETVSDYVDSYADMMLRRQINNYAEEPVDFYVAGLEAIQRHTKLGDRDAVLDVGCSSGEFIVEAAAATGVRSYLIGLDPYTRAYEDFFPDAADRSRFTFIEGAGEAIPLPDSSVKAVTAHNVLFRARDKFRMLAEMQRVAVPGGYIALSTNARDHASRRHFLSRWAASRVSKLLGASNETLFAPAHGSYMEEVPAMIARIGGLAIVERLVQDTEARITNDRLEDYLLALQLSVNRLVNKPPGTHRVWRQVIAEVVEPYIRKEIRWNWWDGIGPYMLDRVHRGLFVLRNDKPEF